MKYVLPSALLLVGLIHLFPMIGVLSTDHLAGLYGVPVKTPDLEILMRHRAVLFGLLGSLLVLAAFRPSLQPLAITAGLISMFSFVVLAVLVGESGPAIDRIVVVDGVASVGLLIATGIQFFFRSRRGAG